MATEVKTGNKAAYATAGTTTVITGASRCVKVTVTTVATTASQIFDNTSGSGSVVLTIPANTIAGTVYDLDWPCDTGITAVVGTAGVLAIKYSQHKG